MLLLWNRNLSKEEVDVFFKQFAPVEIGLSTGKIVMRRERITPAVPLVIELQSPSLTLEGQPIGAIISKKGLVDTATFTLEGQPVTVITPDTFQLSEGIVTVAGQSITPQIAQKQILTAADVSLVGPDIHPQTPNLELLDAATMQLSGPTIAPVYDQAVVLNVASFTLEAPDIDESNPADVSTGAITLTGPTITPVSNPTDLDAVPNAISAYALRLLEPSYPGSLIRVRRVSDAQTLDVNPLGNGDLDVAGIESFLGSSDGEVAIWYDQVGGYDLDIKSGGLGYPLIARAGTVITDSDSKPIVEFEGTDALDAGSFVQPNDNVSVEVVFETNVQNTKMFFTQKREQAGTANQDDGWVLLTTGSGKLRMEFSDGSSELGTGTATDNAYMDNLVHHFLMTYDDTGNEAKFYIDNTEIKTLDITSLATINAALPLGMASAQNENSPFTGKIRSLIVWDRVLTASDAQTLLGF